MIQTLFGIPLDHWNAGFEMVGALLRTWDCVVLYRCKHFAGGSLFTALFFFVWGVFNTIFYPSFGQQYSFIAAIALMLVNGLWLVMAIYYYRQQLRRLAGLA